MITNSPIHNLNIGRLGLNNLNMPNADQAREQEVRGPQNPQDMARLRSLGINASPEAIAQNLAEVDSRRATNESLRPGEQSLMFENPGELLSPYEQQIVSVRQQQFPGRRAQIMHENPGITPLQAHRQAFSEYVEALNEDFRALGPNSVRVMHQTSAAYESIGNYQGSFQVVRQQNPSPAASPQQQQAIVNLARSLGYVNTNRMTANQTRYMVSHMNHTLRQMGVNNLYVVPGGNNGHVNVRVGNPPTGTRAPVMQTLISDTSQQISPSPGVSPTPVTPSPQRPIPNNITQPLVERNSGGSSVTPNNRPGPTPGRTPLFPIAGQNKGS